MPAAFLFYKKALDPYEIQDNYVWKQFYVPLHIRKTNWLLFGEKSACVGCITVFMEVPGNFLRGCSSYVSLATVRTSVRKLVLFHEKDEVAVAMGAGTDHFNPSSHMISGGDIFCPDRSNGGQLYSLSDFLHVLLQGITKHTEEAFFALLRFSIHPVPEEKRSAFIGHSDFRELKAIEPTAPGHELISQFLRNFKPGIHLFSSFCTVRINVINQQGFPAI